MEIFKSFTFESAHRLPNVPPGHKCGRMHGHSYTLEVHLTGALDPELGWIRDFGDVSAVVKPLVARLDHCVLNDVPGLENTTSEHLVRWIWRQLAHDLPELSSVVLRETATSGCVYRGEDEPRVSRPRARRSRRTSARGRRSSGRRA